MRFLVIMFSCFVVAACASQPVPEPMKIGNEVDFALLQDQYANPFPHEDAMEMLMFTDSMAASRDARDAMARVKPDCYEQGKLVFVANVSGMPGLITKFIAVPKMRGYGFPVWLDYEGDATLALPVQEDAVSLIKVSKGEITAVETVQGLDAILQMLEPVCGLKPDQLASK